MKKMILPTNNHNKIPYNINTYYKMFLLCIFYALIPNSSSAAGLPINHVGGILSNKDLPTILANIRTLFPAITSMILGIAFVCGVFFFMRGAWLLHSFGQNQMSNRNNELSGPFIYILVGAALMYIPSTTKVFSNTIFGIFSNDIFAGNTGDEAKMIIVESAKGDANAMFLVQNSIKYDESGGKTLLNYVDLGTGLEWLDLMNTVVMFIQMVGFVAFIRGWFIISHSAGPGAQQGSFSKGIIHLIGGIVSINFVPFMQMVANLVS